MKVSVGNIDFDAVSYGEAADAVVGHVRSRKTGYAVTPNSEILARAKNENFAKVLNEADLVLCDGIGVSLKALLGGKILHRVTGADLALVLAKRAEKENIPIYLYGSCPGIAGKAAQNLRNSFPKIKICGIAHGFEDEEKVLKSIATATATTTATATATEIAIAAADFEQAIVFVGTSSPRQEYFCAKAVKRLSDKGIFFLCVGGVLDVISGNKKRAPKILRILGLEWAYRFAKEPFRIKRFAKALVNSKKT